MRRKDNLPLGVSVHGVSETTRNSLQYFFKGPCKNYCKIVDEEVAQLAIIDLDGVEGRNLLQAHLSRHPDRPYILLALDDKKCGDASFVRKPLNPEMLFSAILSSQAKKASSGGSPDSKRHDGVAEDAETGDSGYRPVSQRDRYAVEITADPVEKDTTATVPGEKFSQTASRVGETSARRGRKHPAQTFPTGMLEQYEIKSLLGKGEVGSVYEGYDPGIERRVAIKILHPHLINGKSGEEPLTRFRREAIFAAKCIHPNIVTILKYGQTGNIPFIVMEFIDGIPLVRFIAYRRKKGRGISLRRSLSIMSQLLEALHTAHELDIVHQNVRDSNVLILKKNGHIKLTDFGMARVMEGSDSSMIDGFPGTSRYLAPELNFGIEADSRADVFSAARLFLELLKMMPESTNVQRSRLPEMAGMPPGNRIDYKATYATAMIPVVTRGLEVDREKRYQSVLEFMQAIKQAL